MGLSHSFFAERFGITERDLESYLSEALSAGGDYADLYFEYLATSSISIDESIVKSATQGVSLGVGVRVIAGERTGYAYSDDLSPEKIRKAAHVAAHIAKGPANVVKTGFEEAQRHNLYPVLTAPNETGLAERVDLVKRADLAARAYDSRVFQVQATYADNLRHVLVATSDGVLSFDRQPLARMSVSALARQDDGAPQHGHSGRRRTRHARFLPERKNAGALRPGSGAPGDRATRRRGCAGRRNDRGAGSGLARHSAARSRGPRPRSRFQSQGRFGLQRAASASRWRARCAR